MTNFKDKKDFSGQKNKLGLSLRTNNGPLGPKVGGKIEYKGQKFTNFKEKKLKKQKLFGVEKQAGAELKNKKRIFRAKSWGKKLKN